MLLARLEARERDPEAMIAWVELDGPGAVEEVGVDIASRRLYREKIEKLRFYYQLDK